MIWLVLLGGIIIGTFLGLFMASMNAAAMAVAALEAARRKDQE